MKKRFIKIIGILFAFVFLFIGSGCSNNVYDGDFCGNAKKTSTEYGKIRATYIADELADQENIDTKFEIKEVNGSKTLVENNESSTATYLFVHYADFYKTNDEGVNEQLVGNYIAQKYSVVLHVNDEAETSQNKYSFSGNEEDVVKANEELTKNISLAARYVEWIKNPKQDSKTSVEQRLSSYSKACFVVGKDGLPDPGGSGVNLKNKTWKDAFKVSFFTGLLVFPIAWLLNSFVNWFGGSGVAQVFAIFLVTLIIKIVVMLITFKGTMSTQKMQDIQPEIARIQAKYANNKSAEAKQRMSMEMMGVYKKYNIKPFAPFLSLIITFPIFIGMYRAVSQTAILRTGNFLGVVLGTTISQNIFGHFKVGALVIFLVMAASQILSMKMPNILNRKRMTLEAKRAQKQTSMMTNIFMIMILVMGFMMPATMSIYWISSALVQVLQSIIMHHINNAAKGKGKYKLKKKEVHYTIPQGVKTDK